MSFLSSFTFIFFSFNNLFHMSGLVGKCSSFFANRAKSLAYVTKLNVKVKNNIIHKLRGSSASSLRCAGLSLVYSAADYGVNVWLNSPHTELIDTQLNKGCSIKNVGFELKI